MAKVRFGQKPDRVFKFLMGARHPRVALAMKSFGFSDEVLQEGWRRLEASTETAPVDAPSVGPTPEILEGLNAVENVWFAVARATLKGNYPSVHDALFANLSQASGRDAAMTVSTFFKRLREMEAGVGMFAVDGAAARALLAERGLTENVVASAETLITKIKSTDKIDDAHAAKKAAREKAVNHLWVWYLEWSAIARVAVKERRLLRAMGFLSGTSGQASEDEEDEVARETEDPGEGVGHAGKVDFDDKKDDPIAAE